MKKLAYFSVVLSLTGCNAFTPFDHPTSDPQLISAARACLDQGDLTCAKNYYSKLGSSADIAASETAFSILNDVGAGMGPLMAAIGSGNGPSGLTSMAGTLSNGSGAAKRKQIYSAYQYVDRIGNPQLRGFVRFISSFALAAEILGEDAGASVNNTGNSNSLKQADLVLNVANCKADTCLAGAGNCAKNPNGHIMPGNTVNLTNSPSPDPSQMDGTPTLGMLNGAILALDKSLSEVGASGKFSVGTGGFTSTIAALSSPTAGAPECFFRQTLLKSNLGL